jgi:rhamnosyltransferase
MNFVSDDDVAALRNSGEFDEEWYVEQYPDVKLLGMDPAQHFLWLGKNLGREPKAAFSQHVREQARRQIIKTVEGTHPTTESLCLFSHYDKHGKVDGYVVDYLQALVSCGFSTIFVTTCEKISDNEIAKVKPLVTKVIVKKNVGRDFGSWFAGIVDSWSIDTYRRVLLANDSVYGPLFDLKDIFEDMEGRSHDLWGITDSYENSYHLQTYFVVFEQKFCNSPAFLAFWDTYRFEIDKRAVIDNFEIGLTTFSRKNGFSVGALCSYYDVRRHALRLVDTSTGIGLTSSQSKITPVNSSHFFWRSCPPDNPDV